MPGRREDVDLDISLNNPKHARRYIAEFDWGPMDPPKYVVYGVDEKIWLGSMTDAEAVIAAGIIREDVHKHQEQRIKSMMEFEIH